MQKKDPPIYVTRPSLPPVEDYEALVREIFQSGYLTNGGAMHKRLEAALTEKLGVPVKLFVNGHLALENMLQAFGLQGGEIITTPFTFISTTHAIVRAGCEPVFCDVEKDYYTLDPMLLEQAITPRTRAILPVHVYGNPCDMAAIERIAAKHGLPVLYDAAHAFGVTINGKGVARDVAEAVKWFQKAAELDYNEAQFILAELYADGRGVPRDPGKAMELYRQAAASGHEGAKERLDALRLS